MVVKVWALGVTVVVWNAFACVIVNDCLIRIGLAESAVPLSRDLSWGGETSFFTLNSFKVWVHEFVVSNQGFIIVEFFNVSIYAN